MRNLIPVVLLVAVSSACSLSDEIKREAAKIPGEEKAAVDYVEGSSSQFDSMVGNSKIPNCASIVARENLKQGYETAQTNLISGAACSKQVAKIVLKNDDDDEDRLKIKLAGCRGFYKKAKRSADATITKLVGWETLFSTIPKKLQDAEKTALTLNNRVTKELTADTAPLGVRTRQQSTKYPNKSKDVDERLRDLIREQSVMNSHLGVCRDQAKAATGKGSVKFDIAVFQKSLTGVGTASSVVHDGMSDLDERLDQLNESYEEVLTRIERNPTHQLYYVKYSWDESSDWDTTKTSPSWRTVSEVKYVQANEGKIDHGWDWELHIEDKQILYKCFATLKSIENGEVKGTKRSAIDADTCSDYVTLAKKMDKIFKGKVIKKKTKTGKFHDPEDGMPTMVDWIVELTIEQKSAGQYAEEATESPAPAGASQMAHVGNEEFGTWHNDGGRRSWRWNEFAMGYLFGSVLSPGPSLWYPYGTIYYDGWYGGYHSYRTTNGYIRGNGRGGLRSSSYTSGSYRTASMNRSVRGAGPSARSRGMGGGGK